MRTVCTIVLFFLLGTQLKAQNLFLRTYGAPGHFNQAADIVEGSDGGLLVAGSTGGWGAQNGDMVVIRTDSAGVQEWVRVYGSSFTETAVKLISLVNGNYLLGGITNRDTLGDYDLYLVMIDSIGDTLWTRQFGTESWDLLKGMTELSDGSVVVTATSYGMPYSNGGMLNLRISNAGDLIWQKFMPLPNKQEAGGITVMPGDTLYAVGSVYDNLNASMDMLLVKMDANGDTIWTKIFGTSSDDHLNAICVAPEQRLAACGYSQFSENSKQAKMMTFDIFGNVPNYTETTAGENLSNNFLDIAFSPVDYTLVVGSIFNDNGVSRAALYRYNTSCISLCSFVFPGEQNSEVSGVLGMSDSNVMCGTDLQYTPGQTSIFVYRAGFDCIPENIELNIDDRSKALPGVAVYPNPSEGRFVVNLEEYGANFQVFDAAGRLISVAVQENQGQYSVMLENSHPGIYWMMIKDRTGNLRAQGKIMIQ